MKPKFSLGSINRRIDSFRRQRERQVFLVLSYIGEDFIDTAREISTYKDQTGNLRSSVGYAIVVDGKVKTPYPEPEGDGTEGASKAKELIDEYARSNPKGWHLIGMAGMEYAAAVESMGLDVITGSTPSDSDIEKDIDYFFDR